MCLAIDPTNPDIVYAGSNGGLFKTSNGGLSWSDPSHGALAGELVTSLAIDPAAPEHIFAGTRDVNLYYTGFIFESTDAGASWSNHLQAAYEIYNLVFDSQRTLYAADYDDYAYYYPGPNTTNSSVYKSSDDGMTWSNEKPGFRISPSTLVVDPTQPSMLYAGSVMGRAVGQGTGIRKSGDGGASWSSPSADLAIERINALLIDPQNPTTLYAGISGGVYKSTDAAASWRLASEDTANLDVSSLAIDPLHPKTLYAGTHNGGVFRSTDAGASWSAFNIGLTISDVSSVVLDRTGTRLHVAAGGLVYDYQIFPGAVDLAVGSDNKTSLLRTDVDGHLSLQTLDSSGQSTTGASHGPYTDWYPTALAEDSNGLAHVLWNNVNGTAAIWLLGPNGNQASYLIGSTPGWTAADVAAGSGGLTHLLWTNSVDGRVSIFTIDASGRVLAKPVFGPYPGWRAVAIADGPDGLTRLLWNKDDGSAGISIVGSGGLLTTYRYPPAAGWTAIDCAVGVGNQTRILWTNVDGRLAVWGVDNVGVLSRGPQYSAPPGFTARRVAAGPDGVARILWTGTDGSGLVWLMSADNLYQETIPLGPN